jgi:putative addiction module component (TIGR02574 family)
MSKSDILEQLPKLGRGDRREILERIWEMEEEDLIKGAQLDANEKSLLDREWAEYQANPNAGSEWKEVESRLRQQIRQ